jgi:endonuclease-3 related protein
MADEPSLFDLSKEAEAEPSMSHPAPGELLQTVYDRLWAHFGPRLWWPAVGTLEPTIAPPFEMIAGAILVQNVAWVNAEKALLGLKQAGLLTPEGIAQVPEAELAEILRPSGYFRQKAAKLKGFVAHLYRHYDGDLARMLARPLPELRVELLALKGIGPETADCILCYAAGLPVMPMDAYTRRIFARIGLWSESFTYEAMQAIFHSHLPEDPALRGEYHAQIDTLGARICLKRAPRCGECPLQSLCERRGVGEVPMGLHSERSVSGGIA